MEDKDKYARFGKEILDGLKGRISLAEMSEEDEDLAQMAVMNGLIRYVEYDPEVHIGYDFESMGIEKGDSLYYWGKLA